MDSLNTQVTRMITATSIGNNVATVGSRNITTGLFGLDTQATLKALHRLIDGLLLKYWLAVFHRKKRKGTSYF
jgi:hypothetical protein